MLPRIVGAVTVAVSLIAGAALVPSPSRTQPPAASSAPALESFQGTFVLAGDARELRAMDQAIDRVVDQLNIFIREIARGEIHRRIVPEQRVVLRVADTQSIALTIDQWGPIAATLGAPARRVRGSSGEDVSLTVRYRDGRLIQHAAAASGARTNTFALSPDEQRLHMHVRITSGQLPADIRYTLTYRRAD